MNLLTSNLSLFKYRMTSPLNGDTITADLYQDDRGLIYLMIDGKKQRVIKTSWGFKWNTMKFKHVK